jgi:cytochrome P450
MDTHSSDVTYPARTIRTSRLSNEAPLELLESLARGRELVVPFRLGSRPAFLLNHPTAIEDVLVSHAGRFVKGRGYDRAARLLGNGLLTADGPGHVERRRRTLPAFQRARMTSYAPLMLRHAARLRDRWQESGLIDVAREMRELTLSIAGEAMFSVDLSDMVDDIAEAVAAATSELDGLLAIVAPPRQATKVRRQLDATVERVLDQRRASADAHDDLLSILLDASDREDPTWARQLADDVLTFLLAGHDTLAHALTWTWLLLSQHPAVESRLATELAEVSGGAAVGAEDLPRLTYTQGILAEALRLFPPAWVIIRQATEPHCCCGVHIPAGGVVVASPFVTHRDERFFPEPLRFDPDRWRGRADGSPAPGPVSGSARFTYFPFGVGGRSCIGERFAWTEGPLVLATLAQAWCLNRASDVPVIPSPRITLRPSRPVLMIPVRR